jgi:hypothetical protein
VQQSTELQTQMSNNSNYQSQIKHAETLSSEDIRFLQKDNKASNYNVRKKR